MPSQRCGRFAGPTKHVPDLLTVKNLAAVLSVPVPYLYAEDEQLAELLLLLHGLPRSQWGTVKKYLARKAGATQKNL